MFASDTLWRVVHATMSLSGYEVVPSLHECSDTDLKGMQQFWCVEAPLFFPFVVRVASRRMNGQLQGRSELRPERSEVVLTGFSQTRNVAEQNLPNGSVSAMKG